MKNFTTPEGWTSSNRSASSGSADLSVSKLNFLLIFVLRNPHPAASRADAQHVSAALTSALRAAPDVASVSPLRLTSDGALIVGTVIPASDPQSTATDGLVGTLQHTAVPEALAGTGATGYVTGVLAAQLQFRDEVSARLPWIILTVVAASFVLLVLTFRAPVLAIKAAVFSHKIPGIGGARQSGASMRMKNAAHSSENRQPATARKTPRPTFAAGGRGKSSAPGKSAISPSSPYPSCWRGP